jgi:hypothetical protein
VRIGRSVRGCEECLETVLDDLKRFPLRMFSRYLSSCVWMSRCGKLVNWWRKKCRATWITSGRLNGLALVVAVEFVAMGRS